MKLTFGRTIRRNPFHPQADQLLYPERNSSAFASYPDFNDIDMPTEPALRLHDVSAKPFEAGKAFNSSIANVDSIVETGVDKQTLSMHGPQIIDTGPGILNSIPDVSLKTSLVARITEQGDEHRCSSVHLKEATHSGTDALDLSLAMDETVNSGVKEADMPRLNGVIDNDNNVSRDKLNVEDLSPPNIISPALACENTSSSISPSWSNVVKYSKSKGWAVKPIFPENRPVATEGDSMSVYGHSYSLRGSSCMSSSKGDLTASKQKKKKSGFTTKN